VILNAVLIPLWGINGAAAASLISYSVCAFLFVFEYTRATGSKIRDLLILNREDLATIRKIGGKTNQQKG
jgi:O-antigen/teichoic acid export membrane protein